MLQTWLVLAGMAGSAAATIAYVAYRFGVFETRVLNTLADHDRRLTKLEGSALALHGLV